MEGLFGILVFLFLLYIVGWIVSFFVFLVGSTPARLQIAIAHGYAILLLLLAMQIGYDNLQPFLFAFCMFDMLAIMLFLFLYVRGVKRSDKSNLVKEIQMIIKSNQNSKYD